MKLKDTLASLLARIKNGVRRFLPTAVYSLAFFAIFTWSLYNYEHSYEQALRSVALAGVFAVLARLALENRGLAARATLITFGASAPLGALCYFLLGKLALSPYTPMWYYGALVSALCAILWLLYKDADGERLFAHLVSKLVFCIAVATVLMLGLMLCIAAFTELLFEIDNRGNLYLAAAAFSFTVVWLNLFLSYLPQKGESVEISKVYRALTVNVALPVYLLLLAILYGYIVKIIVTWTMPVGTMNWYASLALLGYVLLWLGIRFEESKLVSFFKKYVGFAMIPIIIVQLIGIIIRLLAYGLTTARYLSLVCLALGVAVLALSLLKKSVRPVFLAAAALALVVTVTPLNALDVPVYEQQQRLINVLAANDMYYGDAITPNAALPDETKDAIRSCYDYLRGNAPDRERNAFLKQATGKDFKRIYGFDRYANGDSDDKSIYCTGLAYGEALDVSGYDYIAQFDATSSEADIYTFDIRRGETGVSADLESFLAPLVAELESGDNERAMEYTLEDGSKLVLSDLTVKCRGDEPEYAYIGGYILWNEQEQAA